MIKHLKKADRFLDKICFLLGLWLLVLVLRLPNFFEPYWYGDEGIYLTLGNAMNHGVKLYEGIVDHKTPLIYYLAMVPNQLWFRVLNFVFSLVSVSLFYKLTQRIFKSSFIRKFSSLLFVLLTCLPALEGNIPNGELFVMGFVLLGGVIFVENFFKDFVDAKKKTKKVKCHFKSLLSFKKKWLKKPIWWVYFVSGLMMGLGVLTKVPAIFDVAAFLTLGWFVIWQNIEWKKLNLFKFVKNNLAIFNMTLVTALGAVFAVILSIMYFNGRGSGTAYLDFGLLYNFRYVSNWSLPFSGQVLEWLFSLQGKFVVAFALIMGMSLLGKKLSLQFKFVASWLILSLFASTLSNRPYPHYYLQVMPALSLMVGFVLTHLYKILRQKDKLQSKLEFGTAIILLLMMVKVFNLLEVGFYPTRDYYSRYISFMRGEMSREEYYQKFDGLMADNYKAAKIIKMDENPYLFIWGTNPMLYAQTGKVPTGRFTVSFHVRDFDAYQETFDDFVEKEPTFMVMMNNEDQAIEGLEEYLYANYLPNYEFERFVLWKRI